jgi:hypothetical protein
MPLASRGEDGTQPPLHKRSRAAGGGDRTLPRKQQSSILGRCAEDTPRPAPAPIATPRLRYPPAVHAAVAALLDVVVANGESHEQTPAARAGVEAAQATATLPATVVEPASHSTDTPPLGPSTASPRPATWPPPPPRAAHGGGPDLTLLRNGPHDMQLPRTGRDCYLLSVGAHLPALFLLRLHGSPKHGM